MDKYRYIYIYLINSYFVYILHLRTVIPSSVVLVQNIVKIQLMEG